MLSKMLSDVKWPSANAIVTTGASVAASAMVIRSVARDLIPYELQHYVYLSINNWFKSFSSEMVLIIEEFDGLGSNQIYKAAEIYLGSKISPSTNIFMVSMPEKENKITTRIAKNQQVIDKFNGAEFKWRQITTHVDSNKRVQYSVGGEHTSQQSETRCYKLCFHKKYKRMVFESYIPLIIRESTNIKQENKTLRIHTLASENFRRYTGDYAWNSIKLDHPATFDTLAMETELKKMIMDDLERFVRRKEYYRNVGKAWKRGYLLYGPPGTGKSSLIAAMANYLKFDIYDLELNDIRANSDLRKLLIGTANRSILVVEDIDCTLDFQDRKAEERALRILKSNQVNQAQTVNIVRDYNKPNQITLSGLLNFIDGLWSSCGDERIIIFTTNNKDRLDPALLRPGRMDVHIHMSYCTPCAFKTLAANYLRVTNHSLFGEIDMMLEVTKVTPAEIGEQLLRSGELDIEVALNGVIKFLHEKKRENDELEAKKLKEEEEERNLLAEGKQSVENRTE